MHPIAIALIAVVAILVISRFIKSNQKKAQSLEPFPQEWRKILYEYVAFYSSLGELDKGKFEKDIMRFLAYTKITGIGVNVDLRDRILVASSAVIPVFSFPDWNHYDLSEVLIYSGNFNDQFETNGEENRIMGMVGTGYMNGKMILSKPALVQGFKNESDKKNTAIHEFVHLIDMADGVTDGVPSILMERQYTIPWVELIRQKIDDIYDGNSDINPYGATNKAEFFAVISEYFFERPQLLKQKHPKLYEILVKVFDREPLVNNKQKRIKDIGRNDPCYCGSGLKYKKCCGRLK